LSICQSVTNYAQRCTGFTSAATEAHGTVYTGTRCYIIAAKEYRTPSTEVQDITGYYIRASTDAQDTVYTGTSYYIIAVTEVQDTISKGTGYYIIAATEVHNTICTCTAHI
jgi:hypothetical protein